MSEFIEAIEDAIGLSEVLVSFTISKHKKVKYYISSILSGDALRFQKQDKLIKKLLKEKKIDKDEVGILEYENAVEILKSNIRFNNEDVDEDEMLLAIANTDNALVLLYISMIFKAHDIIPKVKDIEEQMQELKKKSLQK